MNSERLNELMERVDRAKALAREIATLNDADPLGFGASFTFRFKQSGNMPFDLLKEIIIAGREAVTARKEAELEGLLNDKQPEPPGDGQRMLVYEMAQNKEITKAILYEDHASMEVRKVSDFAYSVVMMHRREGSAINFQIEGAEIKSRLIETRRMRDPAIAGLPPSLTGRDRCPNCNRVYATAEDFRHVADGGMLTGLCPTRYAPRDPDAQKDCDGIAAGRRSATITAAND